MLNKSSRQLSIFYLIFEKLLNTFYSVSRFLFLNISRIVFIMMLLFFFPPITKSNHNYGNIFLYTRAWNLIFFSLSRVNLIIFSFSEILINSICSDHDVHKGYCYIDLHWLSITGSILFAIKCIKMKPPLANLFFSLILYLFFAIFLIVFWDYLKETGYKMFSLCEIVVTSILFAKYSVSKERKIFCPLS